MSWLSSNFMINPPYPPTPRTGVGGFVVNDKNEVLLVQEKWLRNLKIVHWKLPGGHSDPGQLVPHCDYCVKMALMICSTFIYPSLSLVML